MGTCRYCNQNAGFLRKQHPQCHDLHADGVREMPQLATQAAGTAGLNETALRQTLQAIATRARAPRTTSPRPCQRLGPGRPARHPPRPLVREAPRV